MSLTGTLLSSRLLFLQMDLCDEYMNRLLKIRLSWIAEQLIYMETGKSVEIASAAIYTEDVNGAIVSVLIVDVLDTDVSGLLDCGYCHVNMFTMNFLPSTIRYNYTNMLYKTYAGWHGFASICDAKEDIIEFVTETDVVEFVNIIISILDVIISTCMEYGNIDINDNSPERVSFNTPNNACLVAMTTNLRKLAKKHNLKSRHMCVVISDFIEYDTRTVFACIDHLYYIANSLMDIFEREIAYYDILFATDETEKLELIDEYYTKFGQPFTVWQTNKDYVFDDERMDSVVYNGEIYYCIESHKSTECFDYGKWKSVNADTVEKNLINFKEKQ